MTYFFALQLEEVKVIDLVEKPCNPEKEEGTWISKINLREKNGELRLLEQENVGKCKRECQTRLEKEKLMKVFMF